MYGRKETKRIGHRKDGTRRKVSFSISSEYMVDELSSFDARGGEREEGCDKTISFNPFLRMNLQENVQKRNK